MYAYRLSIVTKQIVLFDDRYDSTMTEESLPLDKFDKVLKIIACIAIVQKIIRD